MIHDRLYMGIDIGTYESKGVLASADTKIVATSVQPHEMEIPRPGFAEHDAELTWWHDFCAISRDLIDKSGINASRIAAVGCSTIAPCCLPVDSQLRPLRKAILYGIDVRAGEEIAFLERQYGRDQIIKRCGSAVTSQSAAAKILWIKNNEPDVFAGTAKFITGSTYLVAKLTGNYAIDHYTAAAWVPMYNIGGAGWDTDLSLFCKPEQLAACRWTHEIAGVVNNDAARETGLMAGTPVVTGTADASAEAVSAGVISPGEMMIMYGSSIFIIHVTERFITDQRIWSGPYLFPGTYSLTAGMSTAGTLTRWYRDQMARDIKAQAEAAGQNPYDALAEAAKDIPPGSEGLIVLPYFSGERTPINDPLAKGMIFGLNLRHTREHIYNACLEGIGYGIAQHFEIFDELNVSTTNVTAVGGGAKHHKWMQIVSDICGRKQYVARDGFGAALGDAMLACLGAGGYGSLREMAEHTQKKRAVIPDETARGIYQECYRQYTALYGATKDIMHGQRAPDAHAAQP